MSRRIRQESPLAARKLQPFAVSPGDSTGVTLYERSFLSHINLRGDPGSPRFAAAVKRALGCVLPFQPNTFVDGEDVRACWLGPDEWLIMCDGDDGPARADGLRRVLHGEFAAVIEVSSGQTVLGMTGGHARDVIAKGCPLDLHARVFGPGHCAQSYLARAGIMILQTTAAPSFELVVRRSYADYVWTWLTDAAAEYGYGVTEAPASLFATEPVLRRASA